MHHIKQISQGKTEDWVHDRFTRYSRGTFEGPNLILKQTRKTIKAVSSFDYVNTLGEVLARSSSGDFTVKGTIIVRREVGDILAAVDLDPVKEKKKGSLRMIDVSGTLDQDRLIALYTNLPDALVLVDVKSTAGPHKLSTKKKPPKPGKADRKFTSAILEKTSLPYLMEAVLFDLEGNDFKQAEVTHKYCIEELIPPKGVDDALKIRLESKRKGKLERVVTVDGKESKSTFSLLV